MLLLPNLRLQLSYHHYAKTPVVVVYRELPALSSRILDRLHSRQDAHESHAALAAIPILL